MGIRLGRNTVSIPPAETPCSANACFIGLKSVFGNLVLGGYDDTRFTPSNVSFSFASDDSRLLTVGVQSIVAMNSLQGVYSLTTTGHLSLIDSTVPHLWLPRDTCDGFEKAFGLTYDPTTDLYLVNDTIHSQLQSLNPSITIKLGNSAFDTGSNYTNIVLPYAAFDLQASYPIYANATNYFPIRRAANDTQYTLGRTLLQEAYLIVDHQRGNFTLAQAAFPDPLPASHIVPIMPPSNSTTNPSSTSTPSKSGLGTGAIAGIAAGGGALLLLILVGAIIWFRRRRNPAKPGELDNTQITTDVKTQSADDGLYGANKPQELSGTQVMELASPANETALGMGSSSKRGAYRYGDPRNPGSPGVHDHLLSPNPQELPTPLNSPSVAHEMPGVPLVHELEGEYYVPLSQRGSRAGSIAKQGYERDR